MSDPSTPRTSHSDDARSDDSPPTDAVTDEVRQDAAAAESVQHPTCPTNLP